MTPKGKFTKFILSQPLDMPADEVVRRGKKAGLKFAKNTVFSSRRRLRERAGDGPVETPKVHILRDFPDPTLAAEPEEPVPVPEPITGAAFVRSMPVDMPVAEVIAKAAEAGITMSAASAYQARSIARRREKEGGPHPEYPVPSITRGLKQKAGPHGLGRSPKREFVRSLPMDMPTDEVIERASAAGLSLTKQQVHQTRFDMRNRTVPREGPQTPPGASRSAARVSRASRASEPAVDASREAKRQAFKALILELGMDDAESIWEDFAAIRRGIRR